MQHKDDIHMWRMEKVEVKLTLQIWEPRCDEACAHQQILSLLIPQVMVPLVE